MNFCRPKECPGEKLFVQVVSLIRLVFIPAAQHLGEEEVQKLFRAYSAAGFDRLFFVSGLGFFPEVMERVFSDTVFDVSLVQAEMSEMFSTDFFRK
jgi:hypothetical protein